MSEDEYLPYLQIPSQLGIREGETLVLASDVTRLAMTALRKERAFDLKRLLDAFTTCLGPSGTLIIPAYNFRLKEGDHYHPKMTKPITGALAEAAFEHPWFLRTRNPLHSFMVRGAHAKEFAGLNNLSSFGPDSPFALMLKLNARMLMAGTTIADAFTYTHHVEEMETVPYRNKQSIKIFVDGESRSIEQEYILYAKKQGWTMRLEKLEALMKKKGLMTEQRINDVIFSIVDLQQAHQLIAADIQNNKAGNIAGLDIQLFLREQAKRILSQLGLYNTPSDKIAHAPDF